jgi:hypothetical protein
MSSGNECVKPLYESTRYEESQTGYNYLKYHQPESSDKKKGDGKVKVHAGSKTFLESIKKNFDLKDKYHVIRTYKSDQYHQLCPLLVEIKDKQVLDKLNGPKYLLQVWNQKGELCFERKLKHPVLEAHITLELIDGDCSGDFYHFVYVPHPEDGVDLHSDIHFVKLNS